MGITYKASTSICTAPSPESQSVKKYLGEESARLQLFCAKARAAASRSSPNVARFFTLGEPVRTTSNAMSSWRARRLKNSDQTAPVSLDVTLALENCDAGSRRFWPAIHEEHLVHRDIKPTKHNTASSGVVIRQSWAQIDRQRWPPRGAECFRSRFIQTAGHSIVEAWYLAGNVQKRRQQDGHGRSQVSKPDYTDAR